jgi:PEP-CTERM motif
MKKLTILLVLFTAFATQANAALITFDDVSNGTNINNQYSDVTFSSVASASGNAYAVTALNPTTADAGHGNVVSLFNDNPTFAAEEGAVKAQFSTLQSTVSIDARMVEAIEILGSNTRSAFLEAFDSGGGLLGSAVYYPFDWQTAGTWDTTHAAPWETLSISHGTADIAYVLFSSQANAAGSSRGQGGIYAEFDNFNFSGGNGGGVISAVPEPETYAMLLAGLGLIGFTVRRRNNNNHNNLAT